MDNDASPVKQFGKIDADIRRVLNSSDVDLHETHVRKIVQSLTRNLELARKFLYDYESEEDSRTQAKLLPQGIEQLGVISKNIVEASQYNVFGPADVAHITANIDLLIERLR